MKRFLLRVKSYFPTALPVGMTAFDKWASDIILLAGPLADDDSIKFVLSNEICHSGPDNFKIPMHWFVTRLKKAAAKQVAAQAFQDVKIRQKEAQEKANLELASGIPQTPVDTAPTGTTSNVPEVP